MNRRPWITAMVSLMIATGCPTEWGMDGAVDLAIRKDLREAQEPGCGEGQKEVPIDPKCTAESCDKRCEGD